MNRRRPAACRRAWPRAKPWLRRGAVVLLVLALYVGAWRPARPLLTRHVAYPLLLAAAPPGAGAAAGAVRLASGRQAVRATPAREGNASARTYRAPAGVRFLLPGLFLAALFPKRGDWLLLWGLHVAAGAAALLLLAGAVRWGVGAGLYDFWTALGRDLFSLLAPLWMAFRGLGGRFLPLREGDSAS